MEEEGLLDDRRVCVLNGQSYCVHCEPLLPQGLSLPEEVQRLSPQLTVLKSYQDVKGGFYLVLSVFRYLINSIWFNKSSAKSDQNRILQNSG